MDSQIHYLKRPRILKILALYLVNQILNNPLAIKMNTAHGNQLSSLVDLAKTSSNNKFNKEFKMMDQVEEMMAMTTVTIRN